MRSLASGVAGVVLGCAGGAASAGAGPTPASSESVSRDPRCVAVADSVRGSTPAADLPLAAPRTSPALPIPRGVAGGEIRTTFLVNPSGRAVRGTVVTVGATDPDFIRRMEDAVMRTLFRAPTVAGCPSWGRGDFRLRGEVRRR